MSLYHVIGFTQKESNSGKTPLFNNEYAKAVQTLGFAHSEKGNVLVYIDNPHKDDAIVAKFGNFQTFYFIRETFLPFLEEGLQNKVIGVIDEAELPKLVSRSWKL
jgi:hypothetical protein